MKLQVNIKDDKHDSIYYFVVTNMDQLDHIVNTFYNSYVNTIMRRIEKNMNDGLDVIRININNKTILTILVDEK